MHLVELLTSIPSTPMSARGDEVKPSSSDLGDLQGSAVLMERKDEIVILQRAVLTWGGITYCSVLDPLFL